MPRPTDPHPDPGPAEPSRHDGDAPLISNAWPVPTGPGGPPVLLFGGTFDPPHRGHATVALAARDRVFAQPAANARDDGAVTAKPWLVLVPAARSPHKAAAPGASDADRVAMLGLAFAGEPRVAVWTTELDRSADNPDEPSYWIDTLRHAREAARPGASLRFLIGADQALAFHRWKSFREILALAHPAVPLRSPHATPEQLAAALEETGAWDARDLAWWASWTVDTPVIDASATDARAALASGERARARQILGDAVASYAIEKGLYTS